MSHRPPSVAVCTTAFILQPKPLTSVATSATPTNPDLFPSSTGSVDPGLKSLGIVFATSPAVSEGTVHAPISASIPVSSAGPAVQSPLTFSQTAVGSATSLVSLQ